jgi:hypothetical protein
VHYHFEGRVEAFLVAKTWEPHTLTNNERAARCSGKTQDTTLQDRVPNDFGFRTFCRARGNKCIQGGSAEVIFCRASTSVFGSPRRFPYTGALAPTSSAEKKATSKVVGRFVSQCVVSVPWLNVPCVVLC